MRRVRRRGNGIMAAATAQQHDVQRPQRGVQHVDLGSKSADNPASVQMPARSAPVAPIATKYPPVAPLWRAVAQLFAPDAAPAVTQIVAVAKPARGRALTGDDDIFAHGAAIMLLQPSRLRGIASGSPRPVVALGLSLEASKLIAAGWLAAHWQAVAWFGPRSLRCC
jgi:hypothetical protein